MVRALDDGAGFDSAEQRLKVPPNSVEAEQSLLGGLMLDSPNILVHDFEGSFPLALQRDRLTTPTLPFQREILNDVIEDFIRNGNNASARHSFPLTS